MNKETCHNTKWLLLFEFAKFKIERSNKMKTKRMLLLITTVVMLSVSNTAVASPVISWVPNKIKIEQMQGTQSIHTMIVKSTKDLQDIIARVVPELQPWVSVSPASIGVIQKENDLELTITINVPPDSMVGEYDGVIQLKQATVGKNQRVIANPLPIKLVITEQEDNEVLPPDPGEAGKQTLSGIDSDSDGVRDDIQRYIYFAYPDDEKVRVALTQVAIEYQGLLSQASDPDAAFNHATRMARHGECLDYIQGEIASDTLAALKAEFLNTKERSLAYINYSDTLGGEIILGAPLQNWKNSCNFDVDAIGGIQ